MTDRAVQSVPDITTDQERRQPMHMLIDALSGAARTPNPASRCLLTTAA